MTGWTDEVQANVDATIVVGRQRTFNFEFLLQVSLKLRVEMIDNGFERVVFVDLVAVADGVANSKLQSNVAFLQLVGLSLQFDHWQRVGTRGRLEVRVEQRVHEGAFAEPSLADAENVEDESILHTFVHKLIGEAVKPDMSTQLQIAEMIFVLQPEQN